MRIPPLALSESVVSVRQPMFDVWYFVKVPYQQIGLVPPSCLIRTCTYLGCDVSQLDYDHYGTFDGHLHSFICQREVFLKNIPQ